MVNSTFFYGQLITFYLVNTTVKNENVNENVNDLATVILAKIIDTLLRKTQVRIKK